ncbi:MAG: SRPBCC family protein [Ilumatobacteraceae bacterium]
MRSTVTAVVTGASPADVFAQVESLDTYPAWLRLVHRVEPDDPEDGRSAWQVELRARVGPFARSKRLRMVRTVFEPGRRVKFERVQDDDRDHAEWILGAEVAPDADGTLLTMDLEYTGDLWGDSLLQPLLDEEVRRGKRALQDVVTAGAR